MTGSETLSWVPESCTLPTAEQPVRVAEFDAFFAESVQATQRLDAERARFELSTAAGEAARVADLMAREAACCAFFTFALVASAGGLALEVSVPRGRADV
ncbi:MAG: hypothetical protein ACRDU4_21035, partial [Mycobacterium sp.]